MPPRTKCTLRPLQEKAEEQGQVPGEAQEKKQVPGAGTRGGGEKHRDAADEGEDQGEPTSEVYADGQVDDDDGEQGEMGRRWASGAHRVGIEEDEEGGR